jgi:hypothetical protein
MMKVLYCSVLLAAGSTGADQAAVPRVGARATVCPASRDADGSAAVLAEYNARRETINNTPDAHFALGVWCEQKGLKAEAMVEFAATLALDAGREAAWKHLGFKRHKGRWMTESQIAAHEHEARAQRRADRQWEPRLRRWKSWLAVKAKEGEAEAALAGVTDPRAVPSVRRVFATGRVHDQRQAVQLLGHIPGAAASRELAILAVSGESAEVRRTAIETVRWRDPLEFADVLIGLLRDPVKYDVRPVGGPGLPGSVTVKGCAFNVERIYAPPPPPDLPIYPGEEVSLDGGGLPIIVRHTDETVLPFAWVEKGYTFPSGCIIPPHVPVGIQLGAMWLENWKSAHSAEKQLRGDVAAINRGNDLLRAANAQVVQVLCQTTGKRLPVDRAAWRAWWFRRLGRTQTPRFEPPRPTLTEFVPLDYLPGIVGGVGFDPLTGYYLRVPTLRQ